MPESFDRKAVRQLISKYMPQIAQLACKFLPMEQLRDRDFLWSWAANVLGVIVSKLTPDDGMWGLIDDLQQDFFAAIGIEISKKEGGAGAKPKAPDVETDAETNYITIAGAAALLETEKRRAFFLWYNGLGAKRQAAFRRLAGKAAKEQLVGYVTMPEPERDMAIDGYLALNPVPAETHDSHGIGLHGIDVHHMWGWLHDHTHPLWEHTEGAREEIRETAEDLRRRMRARTKTLRERKKRWWEIF